MLRSLKSFNKNHAIFTINFFLNTIEISSFFFNIPHFELLLLWIDISGVTYQTFDKSHWSFSMK